MRNKCEHVRSTWLLLHCHCYYYYYKIWLSSIFCIGKPLVNIKLERTTASHLGASFTELSISEAVWSQICAYHLEHLLLCAYFLFYSFICSQHLNKQWSHQKLHVLLRQGHHFWITTYLLDFTLSCTTSSSQFLQVIQVAFKVGHSQICPDLFIWLITKIYLI